MRNPPSQHPGVLSRIAARIAGPFSAAGRGRARRSSKARADANLARAIADVCKRAAAGDQDARIDVRDPSSELAQAALAINQVLDLSDAFVREAAAAMAHCSRDEFYRPILLRGLKGGFRQSALVINDAGKKMREHANHLSQVAALAENTAKTVADVAKACEALDGEGREIVNQVQGSAHEMSVVVSKASEAMSAVETMRGSAREVGKIIGTISTIAEQTHLLALNASIEAARAGEAGRGFAVVAREVQDLAQNVASASSKIGEQVQAMVATIQQVVSIIADVNGSAERVAHSTSTIASAVADQASATKGIASSISEVRRTSEDVSSSMERAHLEKSSRAAPSRRPR
jgi:methyl-accepting chemotaxis protein